MRISDWSSDVCSSDLAERSTFSLCPGRPKRRSMKGGRPQAFGRSARSDLRGDLDRGRRKGLSAEAAQLKEHPMKKLGRASCRERECQEVYISDGGVSCKKKSSRRREILEDEK